MIEVNIGVLRVQGSRFNVQLESVKLVFSNLLLMQVSGFDKGAANCLSDLGGLNQNPLTI